MSTEIIDTDNEHGPTTIEVDHSPTRVSSYAAVGASIIAAITSAPFALLSLPLGIGGVGILAGGLFRGDGNRGWVALGTVSLFLSVLIAGGFGTPPELLLVSMATTVLAWNFGQNAIGLGEQIGRHSETQRNEVIHCAVATIVAMVVAGFGYTVFSVAGGGQPLGALTMVLFGLIFLIWAIRT